MSCMNDPRPGANGEKPPGAVWGGSYRSTYYYLHFRSYCTNGARRSSVDRGRRFGYNVQKVIVYGTQRTRREIPL